MKIFSLALASTLMFLLSSVATLPAVAQSTAEQHDTSVPTNYDIDNVDSSAFRSKLAVVTCSILAVKREPTPI